MPSRGAPGLRLLSKAEGAKLQGCMHPVGSGGRARRWFGVAAGGFAAWSWPTWDLLVHSTSIHTVC